MRIFLIVVGTFVQVSGVATAALGIRRVRIDFEAGVGILGETRNTLQVVSLPIATFFRRLFRIHPQPAQLSGAASAAFGASGQATAPVTITPFPSLDSERIQWLKARFDVLQSQLAAIEQENSRSQVAMNEHVSVSAEEHRQLDEMSRSRIRDFATGGLRLQSTGVALLISGSILLMIGSIIH